MRNKTIENTEKLKSIYLQTDITNIAAVQYAVKEISDNAYGVGKEKYLEALNAATPANIAKAKKYNNAPEYMRYLGWGIIVFFFAMAMLFDDSSLFEESTVTWPYIGIWAGIGIQIYIAVLKSAWEKLTLSGAVIHPALKIVPAQFSVTSKTHETQTSQTTFSNQEEKYILCSKCGCKNKTNARFCENCGIEL